MSEADKIIKNLKNSGKKVEEFYVSNKTSDKNVANIQDDVKIVKEFIDYAQGIIEDMEYERPVDVTVYQKELTSMTNILAEREQDKKRIRKLEEELEKANRQLDLDYVDENFIPTQVVIDKIEELKKLKTALPVEYLKEAQIKVLQELLGGVKNNENIKS